MRCRVRWQTPTSPEQAFAEGAHLGVGELGTGGVKAELLEQLEGCQGQQQPPSAPPQATAKVVGSPDRSALRRP